MSFTYITSSDDRETWLAARREGVTATEAAALASGGTSTWSNLRADKAGATTPWTGNQFTEWGNAREPDIAASVSSMYPHLKHNTYLVASNDDPRFMCTPDMIGDDGKTLCQIKTSLWKGDKWAFGDIPQRYIDQCQFEMFVTNTDVNLLAVEFYDELDTGGFVPHDWSADPHIIAIERDDDRIAELVAIAEQFLAMGEPDTLDIYLADYARADAREKAAKAEKDEARKLIAKEIAERPSGKYVGDIGSVTQGKDKTETVTVFDEVRFKEKAPKTWAKYVTEKEKTTKGRLTITPAKEGKAA
ncbi:MAG: YqaJ viral recombinase family protein [Brevibacterium aurantiacum]